MRARLDPASAKPQTRYGRPWPGIIAVDNRFGLSSESRLLCYKLFNHT